MSSLNDLLKFIENSPHIEERPHWYEEDWRRNLDRQVPGWKELIMDPNNWKAVEEVAPKQDMHHLCEVFLKEVGYDLAVRWFFNPVYDDQRREAERWFENLDNISAAIWKKLDGSIRGYIIKEAIDKGTRSLRSAMRHWFHIYHDIFELTIDFPSKELIRLREIVEDAGDTSSLNRIQEIYQENLRFAEMYLFEYANKAKYRPDRRERKLISLLMGKVMSSGFRPASLPAIKISYDSPPLFIAYPELEDSEESRYELFDIEEVLGCYKPDDVTIILYAKGLSWCARTIDLDERVLRAVVLIHELGHWITHLFPKNGVPEWQLDLYKLTEKEVHEGWAQLLTCWVAESEDGKFKETFEKLNRFQSRPYKVFEDFTDISESKVMSSLERLRQLRWPARLMDWESFI